MFILRLIKQESPGRAQNFSENIKADVALRFLISGRCKTCFSFFTDSHTELSNIMDDRLDLIDRLA